MISANLEPCFHSKILDLLNVLPYPAGLEFYLRGAPFFGGAAFFADSRRMATGQRHGVSVGNERWSEPRKNIDNAETGRKVTSC